MKKSGKLLALVYVFAIMISMLTGCGGTVPTSTEAVPAASSAPEDEAAPQDTPVKLTFTSGGMTESSQNGYAMTVFADKVAEYSNGSVTAVNYFDTQLGDVASQVQSVTQGTIDMVVAGVAYYTTYVPEIDVFQLPFAFSSYDEAHAAADGALGDAVKAKFEGTGMKILGFWDIGFRHLTNNERAINSIDDLAGLKLRSLPSNIQVEAWETFGALPTAIDYSELYQSLQTGIVSGQENPISEIITQKFYEIQHYVSLTYHVFTPAPVAISENVWNKLSDAQKDAVTKAMADATQACRDKLAEIETNGLKTIKDFGCEVNENPDTSGFEALAPTVWKLFTDSYGTELVDLIK